VTQLRARLLLIALITTVSSYVNAQGLPALARQMVGHEFRYTAKARYTLVSIGFRSGIESGILTAMNGLKTNTALKPGQVLDIDNRLIVPTDLPDDILVNLPQRKLFFLNSSKVQENYPIVRILAAANDLDRRIYWGKANKVTSRVESVAREIGTSATDYRAL